MPAPAGTAMAAVAGARPDCRSSRRSRRATLKTELRWSSRDSEAILGGLRIAAQPGFETNRRLAGIAHGALRVLESLGDKGEALLEIGASGGIVARGVDGNVPQRFAGLRGDLGKLMLTAAERLQPIDDRAALAVGLVEQAGEDEG